MSHRTLVVAMLLATSAGSAPPGGFQNSGPTPHIVPWSHLQQGAAAIGAAPGTWGPQPLPNATGVPNATHPLLHDTSRVVVARPEAP